MPVVAFVIKKNSIHSAPNNKTTLLTFVVTFKSLQANTKKKNPKKTPKILSTIDQVAVLVFFNIQLAKIFNVYLHVLCLNSFKKFTYFSSHAQFKDCLNCIRYICNSFLLP